MTHPPLSCHTASALALRVKASFVVILSVFLWSYGIQDLTIYFPALFSLLSFSVIRPSFTFLLPQSTRQSYCESLYLISPCDDFLLVMVEGVLWNGAECMLCWSPAVGQAPASVSTGVLHRLLRVLSHLRLITGACCVTDDKSLVLTYSK